MASAGLIALGGAPGSPYTRKMLAVLRYRRIPYRLFWPGREPAGRYRAVSLLGVKAVGLPVEEVVDEVEAGGEGAEGGTDRQCAHRRFPLEGDLPEQQRGEDEEVLRPLPGSQGLHESSGAHLDLD